MQPMEVQDVIGQQRWVDPLKNLNCCTVIGFTHPLAMEVPLGKRWYKSIYWEFIDKSCTFNINKQMWRKRNDKARNIASNTVYSPPQQKKIEKYLENTSQESIAVKHSAPHLLCVKWGHFFASLLEGLSSLGEALELSASLETGLGPEVLILWVLRILIVGYDQL